MLQVIFTLFILFYSLHFLNILKDSISKSVSVCLLIIETYLLFRNFVGVYYYLFEYNSLVKII